MASKKFKKTNSHQLAPANETALQQSPFARMDSPDPDEYQNLTTDEYIELLVQKKKRQTAHLEAKQEQNLVS